MNIIINTKTQASKHLYYSTVGSKNYRYHLYLIMFYDHFAKNYFLARW